MRAFVGLLLLAGCAGNRFADRPVVWRVADDRDVPEPPQERKYLAIPYLANVFLLRRATRTLEVRPSEPARNTNAWDEVPDSTWFTNRIGVLALSPETIARGPIDGPDPTAPLTITSGKSGGGNPGFVAKDSGGRKFLVKFDTKENPEMQTATDVIVSRIFHALGYNVPQNRVFTFCPADLRIAPSATTKNPLGEKEPFTPERLGALLERVHRLPSGCYRALASEYLPGAPLGGAPPEGVRSDDPNDTVAHEHRRELRALRVFAAWVNHTDMKEDNTLDMWVELEGRHFVRHHLLDFGEAFAAHAAEKHRNEDGYEHFWDWERQPLALLSLGLWVRPWEHLESSPWPSVGTFTHEHFDPVQWREAYPYWPFMEMDHADAYWAAKQILRFSKEALEAVVNEGELSDPAAAAWLTEVLDRRARIIGETYLEAVTPLDRFLVRGRSLFLTDLGIRFGLASEGTVEVLGKDGDPESEIVVDRTGRVRIALPEREEYALIRLRVRRGTAIKPVLELHVVGGENPRLVGVIRHGPRT